MDSCDALDSDVRATLAKHNSKSKGSVDFELKLADVTAKSFDGFSSLHTCLPEVF